MTETATTAAPARTLPNDSVVAVYDTPDKATRAIESLVKAGFPSDRVSVIGQSLQSEVQLNGFVTTGDVAKTGAAAGAWVGGLFGLLTVSPPSSSRVLARCWRSDRSHQPLSAQRRALSVPVCSARSSATSSRRSTSPNTRNT